MRWLALLALTGCSFAVTRNPASSTVRGGCTTSRAAPIADGLAGVAAGVGAAVLTMYAMIPFRETPETRGDHMLVAGGLAVAEAAFVTSSVIGTRRVRRCAAAESW